MNYKSAVGLIAATLSVIFLAGCPDADGADVFVTSMEVTQAFQDATNAVALVSNRTTTVRVRVGVVGDGPATNVSGTLRVFVNGAEVTPAAGIAPINPGLAVPATATWDRDNEAHTLNFELPSPNGLSPSTDVDFVVELSAPGDPDTTNNTGSVEDLTVVERITPMLYFTRINYTPAGAGLPALADVQAGVGDAFVVGIYPVDDADTELYREGLFPTLTWSQDPNGNGLIDGDGEHSDLLDWLEACRQLIVDEEGNGDMIFLYGWVAGNPIPSNGWGRTGGRVAFGNTEHSRHQRTFAHELGHNFGLSHNNRTLAPDAGWDSGARLDGNPATNNTTGRVKPSPRNDIMVGGLLTDQAWVDQTTYEYFLGHAVLDPAGPGGPDARYSQGVVAVSGVLTTDGRQLVRLNPVFRYPWLSQPSISDPEGQYTVQVQTAEGNVFETAFNGILGDDARESTEDDFGFFAVRLAVPANEELARVVLLRRDDGTILGELERSSAPRIQIIEPRAGERLGGRVTVRFDVEDPDTALDQIRVQLAYSSDGGTQWVPVAVNLTASDGSAAFDAEEVVGSNAVGVIRAIASDGLNTAFDDVGDLTVEGGRSLP